MATFVFDYDDIDKYYQIFTVSSEINEIYIYLYDLEYKGKKESEEYKKTIDLLKNKIKEEKKLYDDPKISSKLCGDFMSLILETQLPKPYLGDMENILTLDIESLTAKRVLTKLEMKLIGKQNLLSNTTIPFQTQQTLDSLSIQDIESLLNKTIPDSMKLQRVFDRDAYSIFLSNIEEIINIPSFVNLKSKFLSVKYLTAFIIPEIETEMLYDNFKVKESVFINSRTFADINHFDDNIYLSVKNIYGIEIAQAQLNLLLGISDYDYSNPNKNIEALLRQAMLRAVLFLVSTNTIKSLRDSFNTCISSVEYQKEEITRRISESIIIEAFNKVPKDKEKHKVISFKPNSPF